MEDEIIADANEVFTKTDFQDDIDYNTYPISVYECPICYNKLSFTKNSFQKYRMNTFSNFSDDELTRINQLIKNKNLKATNSFLEYYCPKCKSPTRVYFTTWAGGRFTGGYRLSYIIALRMR